MSVGEVQASDVFICSQNLNRWGSTEGRISPKQSTKQKQYIISRIVRGRCNVVALQEVWGESRKEAEKTANILARSLTERAGRSYRAVVSASNDPYIRNGFLVDTSVFSIEQVRSYAGLSIPKLQSLGPPTYFSRGPLAVVLRNKKGKRLFVISIHLKSKANAWKDISRTGFETIRMQLAERLRIQALADVKKLGPETVLVIAGDRNNTETSASAQILEGRRVLSDFSAPGLCSLTRDHQPRCGTTSPRVPALIALFSRRKMEAPERYSRGSYRYKRKEEIIDDILIREEDFLRFRRPDGTLAIGYRGAFNKGSDHKLLWAQMRW